MACLGSRGRSMLKRCAKIVQYRSLTTSSKYEKKFNEPLSGNDMPRAGGIASMMRLPTQDSTAGLDVCFVGVPLDIGVSNRSGTRFGPRQIRTESALIRHTNNGTGASPFTSLQVADVGDVWFNIYNLPEAVKNIKDGFLKLMENGCKTLALGGDHTMTYPILQAVKEKHGPVGLIHIDAHADTQDTMLGAPIAHGTPFRRAFDDGCLDSNRVVQIGLRGSGYGPDDYQWARDQMPMRTRVRDTMLGAAIYHGTPFRRAFDEGCIDNDRVVQIGLRGTGSGPEDYQWSREQEKYGPVGLIHVDAHDDTAGEICGSQIWHGAPFRLASEAGCLDDSRVVQIGLRGTGFGVDEYDWAKRKGWRVVQVEECWHKSLAPLMAEVRQQMGDGPVYISFDIDAIDPAYAPGTGTPEIAGLTPIQGLEILRGCRGLNIIGGDLVEVSPPYDPFGTTALLGANLLFEMLCVLPGVKYHDRPYGHK